MAQNIFTNITVPDQIKITPEQFEHLLEGYPYPDDGKNCPECGTPLTIDRRIDEAFCENCNFTIYDYSEI